MKLLPIEGSKMRLDGGAMFGNAPKPLWMKWAPPDELNRIDLASRALLLQTDGGQNILFEAGAGCFFDDKLRERYGIFSAEHALLQNLAKIGIQPADVDAVVLTHLHFDHAGGLLSPFHEGPLRLVFPRAKFYVSRKHWERALHPPMREKASFIPMLHQLLEESGRLVYLEGSTHHELPSTVSFYYSDGHTIGLVVPLIEQEKGLIAYASDVVPGMPWLNLPIAMGYDRFPELLIEEKTALLASLYEREGMLFFTHDPKTAAVKISREASGKYFGTPITP